MDARRLSDAGLVGLRGKVAADLARRLSGVTPFREETLRMVVGGYLVFSRTRRMLQMAARARRG